MTSAINLQSTFTKAARAVRDGYAASLASIISVLLLMWLRTTMSYQHVHGVPIATAFSILYSDGGIPRFYRGVLPALVMMPLSRFGDIFSNELARQFLATRFSAAIVTAVASTLASSWRLLISPVSTVKTLMQVHGDEAPSILKAKVGKMGFLALYEGSMGSALATWVGHYPWFVTYNFLNGLCVRHQILDAHFADSKGVRRHIRRACIGFCSSLVSDVCSNGIRVVKTCKQTSLNPIGYIEAGSSIISESGFTGLLFRGLSTKISYNALNAVLFTVVWKAIADHISQSRAAVEKKDGKDE
mmetsp:Transcript_22390/g.34506  ORF Transcript_22390/g.34506 Transcript_22390/m.34506 type:complete len:301 (+) Transcript_22390:183-1085(+)